MVGAMLMVVTVVDLPLLRRPYYPAYSERTGRAIWHSSTPVLGSNLALGG